MKRLDATVLGRSVDVVLDDELAELVVCSAEHVRLSASEDAGAGVDVGAELLGAGVLVDGGGVVDDVGSALDDGGTDVAETLLVVSVQPAAPSPE